MPAGVDRSRARPIGPRECGQRMVGMALGRRGLRLVSDVGLICALSG